MLEDKYLLLAFKQGRREALARIYEKYRTYLLKVSIALLSDVSTAEDIVHDVFVQFARSEQTIKLIGSLKSYLRTCVINRVRNRIRSESIRSSVVMDHTPPVASTDDDPVHWVSLNEQSKSISNALARLPYEQREVVTLHLLGDMTFREIAKLQAVPLKTIQSRYRYGCDKLRSLLNHEAIK